jgi:putative spermidine/putrescine transport system permease protein
VSAIMHSSSINRGESMSVALPGETAETQRLAGTSVLPSRRFGGSIGVWQPFTVVSSMFLVFIVVTPILICLWGSFTTLTVMGTASETGAGWSKPAVAAGADIKRENLGIFAEGARLVTGTWTTRWYEYVVKVYGHTLRLSLMLAAFSIAICIVLGVLGSYALVKYEFWGKSLLEELILLPLALPGIAVGVALIETYGVLRGSWAIILFGHLLYTLPFMIQTIVSALRSFDFVELEQAAAVHGANFWQRLRYILLPNLKHAIIVGSLLVFAISMGEFNASFLLATPFNQTLPAALYDSYTNDSFQVSSAATTLFMALVIPVLIAIQFIGGKEMQRAGQAA